MSDVPTPSAPATQPGDSAISANSAWNLERLHRALSGFRTTLHLLDINPEQCEVIVHQPLIEDCELVQAELTICRNNYKLEATLYLQFN